MSIAIKTYYRGASRKSWKGHQYSLEVNFHFLKVLNNRSN